MKAKRILKDIVVILILLSMLASMTILLIFEWNGLWSQKAGYESVEACRVSSAILHLEQKGIDEEYRDKLIKMFKE